MKKLPPLPKSELEIARVVWGLGDATVRQVVETLPAERELDFWTVQTYLRRLKDKGYLEVRKDGRNNVYSAAVDPDRVIGAWFDDTIERLFDGRAIPAFQHLIEERGITDDEIDELQSVLDDLKAKRAAASGKRRKR
jgi:predicted transcriptional regulator